MPFRILRRVNVFPRPFDSPGSNVASFFPRESGSIRRSIISTAAMGSGSSKPTEHVFYGETPVRFSNDLVESLQSSSETDSTREKTLELHIQSRVESELQRLQQRESQILNDLEAKLTAEDKKHGGAEKNPGREKVQNEINTLKRKLDGMPKVQELDKDVERAREEVIKCLRSNDRTPLDCYKEVDEFKAQTRRLERQFVVRTVGRDFPAGH